MKIEKTMTDEELLKKIDYVCANFVGQLDDLQAAVGMLVTGRLFGWRVIRLISSRRHWSVACNLFGDLKELLPERGVLAHKSAGLVIVDKAGDYWEYVKGHKPLPSHERKQIA